MFVPRAAGLSTAGTGAFRARVLPPGPGLAGGSVEQGNVGGERSFVPLMTSSISPTRGWRIHLSARSGLRSGVAGRVGPVGTDVGPAAHPADRATMTAMAAELDGD